MTAIGERRGIDVNIAQTHTGQGDAPLELIRHHLSGVEIGHAVLVAQHHLAHSRPCIDTAQVRPLLQTVAAIVADKGAVGS